jgi:hypothetical protein
MDNESNSTADLYIALETVTVILTHNHTRFYNYPAWSVAVRTLTLENGHLLRVSLFHDYSFIAFFMSFIAALNDRSVFFNFHPFCLRRFWLSCFNDSTVKSYTDGNYEEKNNRRTAHLDPHD